MKTPHEITLENKLRKKQLRRAISSMLFISFILLIQAQAIHMYFTWKSLLFAISSALTLGLYVYGLADVAKHSVKGALKFKLINTWALGAYIVVLLLIDSIF
ncbi:MAG: hypothetical protein LBK47_06700 [Prevotellaceae bacterium]|jgi:hypothetical protein|nr:hypothetical protein [Prevotellaceae bacterium]